ncbi:MAG: molybdopterin molybdotransferase MoeA [Oricola sp.]
MSPDSAVAASPCDCDEPLNRDDVLAVSAAAAIARALAVPVRETATVDLGKACGRVAAADLRAPRPMPFFDQSAMDGFAVRIADLAGQGPWRLAVSETVAAGDPPGGRRETGAASRIYTGAPVPAGADAVVKVEDCTDEGAFVAVAHRPRPGENIRTAGSDIARDALLVAAGTRIEPRHVGLLAANGYRELAVFRRPRVGVFSTGSELVSPQAPEAGRIFDSNRPMLIAMVESAGGEAVDLGVVEDDFRATAEFFARHASGCDMLVSSGAVSAGGRDFVRPAFEAAGGEILAWKVALKPGKPALFGTLGAMAYFGLPGNPLATFVGFELFVRAPVMLAGGVSDVQCRETPALAGYSARSKPGRLEIVPARIASRSPEGLPVLEAVGNGSSGTLHALAHADGLAVVPAHRDRIAPGDTLGFIAFSPRQAGLSGVGNT